MRLRILAVGRDRKRVFAEATEEYLRRIARHVQVELVEIPASRQEDPRRARAEEAERILARHGDGRRLVALEVTGKAVSSEKLAGLLGRWIEDARDLDLVVGGDEGLCETVRGRAELLLSLGPMTLPHQLARVVLLEQVYRATTIIRGEPYHK